MFRSTKVSALCILVAMFVAMACQKEEGFADTPEIRFEGFRKIVGQNGNDSAGVLSLYFTDGDGDMGLSPADTVAPFNPGSTFYYNCFVSFFEKQNGTWVKVGFPPPFPGGDTLSNNARIPDLTPTGQNKTLEGTIELGLFLGSPFSPYDTVKYQISICDRALNRSNTVETPEIVVSK